MKEAEVTLWVIEMKFGQPCYDGFYQHVVVDSKPSVQDIARIVAMTIVDINRIYDKVEVRVRPVKVAISIHDDGP